MTLSANMHSNPVRILKLSMVLFFLLISSLYHQSIECNCVNSVLSDLWVSCHSENIPNNRYNANLFDQLHTLSHILLSNPEKGENNLSSSITSQNGKHSLTDVTTYPVCVLQFTQTQY